MSTALASDDIIDHLAGISAGSRLDGLRRRRPVTRDNAEASFRALFEPADAGGVSRIEREAIALYVAALHQEAEPARFFASRLAALPGGAELGQAIADLAARSVTSGPYGAYPPGPLSGEDVAGPQLAADDALTAAVGPRLAAGLAHVHLLVFHPRDASKGALERLTAAGWSVTDIVTLSQLVSFLAFQIRVAAGFRRAGL